MSVVVVRVLLLLLLDAAFQLVCFLLEKLTKNVVRDAGKVGFVIDELDALRRGELLLADPDAVTLDLQCVNEYDDEHAEGGENEQCRAARHSFCERV